MSSESARDPQRTRPTRLGGPRPRVAFLVDWLEDPYQAAVLRGALSLAREQDVTLLTFAGGVLEAEHRNGRFRNHLYRLIDADRLDAVVVMGGTLANRVGLSGLDVFCRQFRELPVCSIAVELPQRSSVLVDNQAGQRAAIEHLVQVHGYRRIGYIRGPEANEEAESRFAAYRDVLEQHGLPFDERLVTEGDFQREGGRQAIAQLFDERKLQLGEMDALAGAADLMLLGAHQELSHRGVRVPEDVALMGFDDIEAARWLSPPLASVEQPLAAQGREALRILLRQLGGTGACERVVLKTQLWPRASCGCSVSGGGGVAKPAGGKYSLQAALIQRRALILAELTRAARGNLGVVGPGWEERLLNALPEALSGMPKPFLGGLELMLARLLATGGDVGIAQLVLGSLRRQVFDCCPDDANTLRTLAELFDSARVMVAEVCQRAQAQQRLELEVGMRLMTDTSARLASASNLVELSEAVYEQLPRLGIRSFYLARYLDRDLTQAELLVAYGGWGRLEPHSRVEFEANRLVPEDYEPFQDAVQFIVEPLFHQDSPLGFAVFDLGEREGFTFEVLRELLSTALRSMSTSPW